jgi:hypothetical protein
LRSSRDQPDRSTRNWSSANHRRKHECTPVAFSERECNSCWAHTQRGVRHEVNNFALHLVVMPCCLEQTLAPRNKVGRCVFEVSKHPERNLEIVYHRRTTEQCGTLVGNTNTSGNHVVRMLPRGEMQPVLEEVGQLDGVPLPGAGATEPVIAWRVAADLRRTIRPPRTRRRQTGSLTVSTGGGDGDELGRSHRTRCYRWGRLLGDVTYPAAPAQFVVRARTKNFLKTDTRGADDFSLPQEPG